MVRQMSDPLLIHIHIPKNAGTTLHRTLRMRRGFWNPLRLPGHVTAFGFYNLRQSAEKIAFLKQLPPDRARRVRFLGGHFGYGVHEYFPQPARYVTVVRDPVEHVLSIHSFFRKSHFYPQMASMSLRAFAEWEGNLEGLHFPDNSQVRYLAADHGDVITTPSDTITPALLDKATARIDGAGASGGDMVTLVQERFDESMLVLQRAMNWKRCHYLTSNVTAERRKQDDVEPDVIAIIRQRNALDQTLYDHACRTLDHRLAQLGVRLPDDIDAFRRANERQALWLRPAYALLGAARELSIRLGAFR